MKEKFRNIFWFFGIFAIVVMLCTFDMDYQELWQNLRKAGVWFPAVILLWVFIYYLNAWSWYVIIRDGKHAKVPFWKVYKLTVSGFALNYATPVGLLGGEAYRIMELSKYIGVQRATSSVILFAMTHIFAHFWFWVSAVLLYVVMAAMGHLPMNAGMAIVLLLISAFCCGGIYLFLKGYKNGMTVKMVRFLGKIPGLRGWGARLMERHKDDLEKIDRQIAELQGQNKRSFFGSLALEYVGRCCQSFEIFFMLALFGIDGGGGWDGYAFIFLQSFLILAFTSLFANLLGFLPLQLGGREGGFAMSEQLMSEFR